MSEIEKIEQYIERTGIKIPKENPYQIRFKDMFALSVMGKEDAIGAIRMAFEYGRAKGYRAAKAEMRHGKID